jgi:hypothetical protein
MATFEETKQTVELHAIYTDALFVCRLIKGFERNRGLHGVASAFCTYNYLSLFLYESWRYLQHHQIISATMPSEDIVARSRHSTKLFDDRQGIDSVINYFMDHVAAAHTRRFTGNTWLRLVRRFETDLGFYIYNDRLVSTTHGVTFAIGIDPDEMLGANSAARLTTIPTEYGQYFGAFWDRSQPLGLSFIDKLEAQRVRTRNVKSSKYYAEHFNGATTPGINALLTVFHAQLNFLDTMLPMDDLPESRQTVLKMQFITLYHVVSSLRKLRDDRGNEPSASSLDYIAHILDGTDLRALITNSSRTFRNTLVHYGLFNDVQFSDFIQLISATHNVRTGCSGSMWTATPWDAEP